MKDFELDGAQDFLDKHQMQHLQAMSDKIADLVHNDMINSKMIAVLVERVDKLEQDLKYTMMPEPTEYFEDKSGDMY